MFESFRNHLQNGKVYYYKNKKVGWARFKTIVLSTIKINNFHQFESDTFWAIKYLSPGWYVIKSTLDNTYNKTKVITFIVINIILVFRELCLFFILITINMNNCEINILIEREQYYLDLLKPEYNILKIAGSMLGFKHSEATKIKMSINRGKKHTYEVRK